MENERSRLVIVPWRVTGTLLAVSAGLIVTSAVGQLVKYATGHDVGFGLIPALDLDGERNIPSWFASILLFCDALLLGLVAAHTGVHRRRYGAHWSLLSILFTGLSLDEIIGLHEQWIEPLRAWLHADGLFYYAWVLPGGLLVLGLALIFTKFLADLPDETRGLFLLAGGFYVGGALGMELLGGLLDSGGRASTPTYALVVTIEEALELLGSITLLHALLGYVSLTSPVVLMGASGARPTPGVSHRHAEEPRM